MTDRYILIGQTPVPCEDLLEWGRWLEDADNNRRVGETLVLGICRVSTIFLGLDHGFSRFRHDIGISPPPVLFESIAFWEGLGGYEQERCCTWAQAEAMHRQMVAEVGRPGAVLAYAWRSLQQAWRDAREDWQERWKELRGVGRQSTGDPMLDLALDQLEKLKERRRQRSYE